MKKDPLEKLTLLLAAMDFTPSDLRYLAEQLQSIPTILLVNRINEIKQMHTPMGYARENSDRFISNVRLNHASDLTVVDRVVRLLQLEAGLPTRYASEKLSEMLIADQVLSSNDIPPVSKKSFREWVRRLQSRVDSKELLRCATLIRNEFVHVRPSDWILKDTLK